ncbi:MAG: hypothetical protein QW520_08225 [Methanomassiliicoccales archaeon]
MTVLYNFLKSKPIFAKAFYNADMRKAVTAPRTSKGLSGPVALTLSLSKYAKAQKNII